MLVNFIISMNKSRKEVKKRAIAYKGGQCQLCGYNKSLSCLTFHHLDPKTKRFNIGQKWNIPWKRLVKELDKTVLLCCNCHAEVHEYPHIENRLKQQELLPNLIPVSKKQKQYHEQNYYL
jgi:hypothetical protein